jgi:hypothetical protein
MSVPSIVVVGWRPVGLPAEMLPRSHRRSDLGECAAVKLLRRTLRWQAALWAVSGAVLLVAPGWLVETALDQPPLGEDAWLRVTGVLAIAMAAQMVLVGHRVEELWWWSWTFVFLEVATAAVFLTNALVGLPEGAAAWPWWALALVNGALGAAQVVGLARAGTERSPS